MSDNPLNLLIEELENDDVSFCFMSDNPLNLLKEELENDDVSFFFIIHLLN